MRSVPATRTAPPSPISRSLAAVSSASAAMSLIMPASFSVAPATEAPPQGMELEPPVPAPVALPGRLGADQHGHAAVIIKADARGVGTIVPARFDIGGNSDAAQPPGRAR